jgi:isopentenyldiphosphate isomerase
MRNHFDIKLAQAFLSGDGAAAKELSRKGKFHHEKMKELHAQASNQIFDQRNKHLVTRKETILDTFRSGTT